MSTPWSKCGSDFLRDEHDWSKGQDVNAPDRVLLRSLLTELEPCSLLDVGCGTGIELDGILAEGLRVEYTGLDITPEFIDACGKLFAPEHHFVCADAWNLEDEGTYTVVSARAVLEHVENGERLLPILFRACSKLLYISFFIAPGKRDVIEVTEDGFLQRRYSLQLLLDAVESLNPSRFERREYQHVGQDWSVWMIGK